MRTAWRDPRDAEAYRIERGLADRLRAAAKPERPHVAREVYRDLYRLVHWHPDLTQSDAARDRKAAGLEFTYGRWMQEARAVLEIGAGGCDVLRRAAPKHPGTWFAAMDVARDPIQAAGMRLPGNVQFLQAGAAAIPFRTGTFDFAYCSQVLEHFHPDDVPDYLREIARVLRPGGWFGLDTPNRISGPHDVSRGFTREATGLHLKEWTYRELIDVLRGFGFSGVWTRVIPGRLARVLRLPAPGPLIPARAKAWLEVGVERIPGLPVRRLFARAAGINGIFLYARRAGAR